MEYIRVTKDNLENEHICCAISNNSDVQVASKKAWLAERFNALSILMLTRRDMYCITQVNVHSTQSMFLS